MKVYNLYSYIYLDKHLQQYRKIIIINKKPEGPLSQFVTQIRNEKRSIFEEYDYTKKHCLYAIRNPTNNKLIDIEDIPELSEFLINNNYNIDYKFSKLIQNNNNFSKDFIFSIQWSEHTST